MMKKLALMAFAILAVAGCSKNSMESEPVAEVYPAVSEAEMEEAKADFAALHPRTKVSHIYQDIPIDGTPDISNYIPVSEVPIICDGYYSLQ